MPFVMAAGNALLSSLRNLVFFGEAGHAEAHILVVDLFMEVPCVAANVYSSDCNYSTCCGWLTGDMPLDCSESVAVYVCAYCAHQSTG